MATLTYLGIKTESETKRHRGWTVSKDAVRLSLRNGKMVRHFECEVVDEVDTSISLSDVVDVYRSFETVNLAPEIEL